MTMSDVENYEFAIKHRVVESEINGLPAYAVELLENPYEGILITYGKVNFEEDEKQEVLKIHFDYELIRDNGNEYDKKEFENHIGDLLQDIIRYEMLRNRLIYTGGTDDNRENDPIEPDSQ